MTTRRVIGPFNRVEGDLEVSLDIEDDRVVAAYVNSPLYRGFEQILQGKVPADALTLVPRICGICSVAQSAAAAMALANASNIVAPANGRLAANLTLATENLADHLTHFYLFFMPDFAREEYSNRPWYSETASRFRAVSGSAANEVLPARASFMQMMGLLAGKWPHTLAVQPGGSSRPLVSSEVFRLRRTLRDFRRFVEEVGLGGALEELSALTTREELETWRQNHHGDLPHFLHIADDLGLWSAGRGTDAFISYGSYVEAGGQLFPAGHWNGKLMPLDIDSISEDISHAWYAATGTAQHPAFGATLPVADKSGAYSWCKAPRIGNKVVETGPLARLMIGKHPLIHDIVKTSGGSIALRVLARWLEIVSVLPAMERWLEEIEPGAPWCVTGELPDDAEGVGLIEAARGALGHWLSVKRGRIHRYQIIAPTTWNFSPRDASNAPGALEQALVGLPLSAGDPIPALIHHIVRSFDPCMVCTVH